MKKQYFVFICIFLAFGLISCQGDATTGPTSSITNQVTSEDLSTSTQTQTTIEATSEQATTIESSSNIETTQATTQEETMTHTEEDTILPTTTEVVTTTEVPTTTLETTTQTPTTINYVTIYFEKGDGASGVIEKTGIAGNPFTMPDDPLKNFHVFDGWYIDENYQTPFDISTYPEADMTVYAKWLRMTIISFDDLTVMLYGLPGESIQMPNDPSKNGFIFDGWYTDPSFTNPFIQTVFPDNDLLLYAKWVEEVTNVDLMVDVLENDYGFTCTNNVCELEEYSWRVYTFNLNTVEFKLEENITDDNDPSYYKNELLVINELWNVDYTISVSTGNTSMRLTGNALTGNYSFSRFSSSIYEEDDYYDDMVNIIQGGQYTSGIVGWIESMLSSAGLSFNDLSN